MALTESKKRDFIKQIIILIETKSQELIDLGYNPENLLSELKTESFLADETEGKQLKALAASKTATAHANETLNKAYRHVSDSVELLTGLLGKNNSLIHEIRKMRK